MRDASLTQRAGRAALWQILGGSWQTLVRLGASVFLARALKPSDFGLFGMAFLYQELLVAALSLGFGTGLIVKKELSDIDLSTNFWMSCVIRICLFLVVFLSAPLAAIFWKESRVEPLIRVISFSLLISIIGLVPETLSVKKLKFDKINIIRALSIFLESLIAVILVFMTNLSYWSLAIAMLVNVLFYNFSLWISEKCWLPKFIFDREVFKYLFRFGFYNWGFCIMNYLRQNLDYLLVGRFLGSYELGLYEFAYRIPHLVFNRISRPVGTVVFPALSKVQDNNEKIFIGYVKAVKFVSLITFPILFGLAAVADILVPVLWGNQWLPIVRPLQILCLCAALRCLFQPIGSIFYCKNRPDIPFKVSAVTLIFTVIFVSILGRFYGLVGVAIGMLLSVLPAFVVLFFTFRFMLNVNPFRLFKTLYPIIMSSLFCGIGAFFAKKMIFSVHLNIKIVLILSIFSGALIYLLSLFLLFPSLIRDIFKNIELIFGRPLKFKSL